MINGHFKLLYTITKSYSTDKKTVERLFLFIHNS